MRHELKFLISLPSAKILKSMLGACMTADSHYKNGRYSVRSLYFDDIDNTAFSDKLDGTAEREKFRLRLYNGDDKYLIFEKKIKNNDMTDKFSELISKDGAKKIISGQSFIDGEVSREFTAKSIGRKLKPTIVIEYMRTAFTYPVQNTRITVDERIRFASPEHFFEQKPPVNFVPNDDRVILEVKYDDVFPQFLIPILSSVPNERISVSKYAICMEIKTKRTEE